MSSTHADRSHHEWRRRVTHADTLSIQEHDQWGRPYVDHHVVCHTEYVCDECGDVRGARECTCEEKRGDRCRIRLEYLGGRA